VLLAAVKEVWAEEAVEEAQRAVKAVNPRQAGVRFTSGALIVNGQISTLMESQKRITTRDFVSGLTLTCSQRMNSGAPAGLVSYSFSLLG
jgi:hypothetical protein